MTTAYKNTVLFWLLLITCVLVAGQTALAQTSRDIRQSVEANPANWKVFESTEGKFVIAFPGLPTVSEQTIENPVWKLVIHKYELKALAEYQVMYADYPAEVIKATPADLLLDEGAKAAVSEANAELISISPTSGDRHPGRLVKERLPSGNIVRVKMLLAGPRMYRIAITTPKEEGEGPETVGFYEATATKFLNSFEVSNRVNVDLPGSETNACPPDALNCFSGEALTAKLLIPPQQPEYPAIARAAHASGPVDVQVLVDERGNVVSAHALRGHPLLQAAAVSAVRSAMFTPLIVNDKPVKFTGVLQIKFSLEQ